MGKAFSMSPRCLLAKCGDEGRQGAKAATGETQDARQWYVADLINATGCLAGKSNQDCFQ